MTTVSHRHVMDSVLCLDSWFDSMRGPDGYGGPVAHWWQNCLHYTGGGLDWRYEGIITGYLNLYAHTSDEHWLNKARRAGDDLLRGQLSSGNFKHSAFELNPNTAGTPHESACDLALLHLADVLKEENQVYCAAARRNIEDFYIAQLWDNQAQSFRDRHDIPSFVPNKVMTLVEALFKLTDITGETKFVEVYGLPTLDKTLKYQIQTGELRGAIFQNSAHNQMIPKFFPYYIARCIPGLLLGYHWNHDERFLNAAVQAGEFVGQCRLEDGSFPQVIYKNQRRNEFPRWIAAVGDILRVMGMLKPYGLEFDEAPTHQWLLAGQNPNGGFQTAHGFGAQVSQRQSSSCPDFRDILPVCGWSDKAFRYLTGLLSAGQTLQPHDAKMTAFEQNCFIKKRSVHYYEDAQRIEYRHNGQTLYTYQKGEAWAKINVQELLWK